MRIFVTLALMGLFLTCSTTTTAWAQGGDDIPTQGPGSPTQAAPEQWEDLYGPVPEGCYRFREFVSDCGLCTGTWNYLGTEITYDRGPLYKDVEVCGTDDITGGGNQTFLGYRCTVDPTCGTFTSPQKTTNLKDSFPFLFDAGGNVINLSISQNTALMEKYSQFQDFQIQLVGDHEVAYISGAWVMLAYETPWSKKIQWVLVTPALEMALVDLFISEIP